MISSTSVTNNVNEQKKIHYGNKGFLRSQIASMPVIMASGFASKQFVNGIKKVSDLSKEDSVILIKAAQEGLSKTGLKEKGVKTYILEAVNLDKIKKGDISEFNKLCSFNRKDLKGIQAFKTELKSNKLINKFIDTFSKNCDIFSDKDEFFNIIANIQASSVKSGSNAFYLRHANKIILPEKVFKTSVFHEMGHALNNNGGNVLKLLQKVRPAAMIMPSAILLASLLNKRKATDEPSDNKAVRVWDGIKKNAGKLTALSMLPMVLEEGIASLRGDKIARGLVKDGKLTKDLLKKIRLTNASGFATYALTAAGTVLSTKIAIKVKDKIQERYETKKLQKVEMKAQKKAENLTQNES